MKIKTKLGSFDLMVGTDAEFFLCKDGVVVPASQYIPGTKAEPYKLDNGVCHPDGLSLEVGCPPSDTPKGMLLNLMKVLHEVNVKFLKPNGLTILDDYKVAVEDVEGATDADLEFGCGVELMAWNVSRNTLNYKRPIGDTSKYRYSGFHIHLGFVEGQVESVETAFDMSNLVANLDAAMRSAGITPPLDRSVQYGGYGAFRIKPYGIEYRALDCTVITDTAKMYKLMKVLDQLPKIFIRATSRSLKISTLYTHQTADLVSRLDSLQR